MSAAIDNRTIDAAEAAIRSKGWVVLEHVIPEPLVAKLRIDLALAWEICRSIQVRNGVASDADLTVHHLVGIKASFLEVIDAFLPLDGLIEHYFDGKYILNSMGGAVNLKDHRSYAQRIHRDIRSFSGEMPLLLNTLVMLDDFTPENGATWMLTGGHRMAEKPSQEVFAQSAEQALGPAGSVLLFNSNLWHSGGENRTDRPRRSITPMFCRPFIKPQFDYPRVLGYDAADNLSAYARQVVGYNARIPATLDEWYQPPEHRMYRPDQG
jgi:hypothetical protein